MHSGDSVKEIAGSKIFPPERTSSAIGAMFGALIFGVVQMGIFYTGIDTDWFKLFMGAMMVIAVLFNSYVRSRAMRSR